MLVKLGQRAKSEDIVDLLVECHGRIRKFLGFARDLALAHDAPREEIRQLAAQVRRYFAVSLPLHVADEEELIEPALAGTSAEIDDALAAMHAEHATHEPALARLVGTCAWLERDPSVLASVGETLAATAAELAAEFEPHLAREERVIFPALAALAADRRDAIRAAMRARREQIA